jgi:hypothetical protein
MDNALQTQILESNIYGIIDIFCNDLIENITNAFCPNVKE